jgi:hypothetical protein
LQTALFIAVDGQTILKRNKKRLKQNKNLLGLPMPEGD